MPCKAKKSFAAKSLHVQIEALSARFGITVPSKSDSGAVGRERRGSGPSGQSCKRNGGQGRLLLLRSLLPMPSIRNEGCKRNDRDGDNPCAYLQPPLTTMRAVNWFVRDYGNDWPDRRLQFTDESIPPPRQRLDKARSFGRVPKHLPDFVDCRIEVALDIHKRVRPEALLQLLPRHHLARAFQQDGEHLERLPAELQLHTILAQLARPHVCFERAEANKPGTGLCFSHWGRSRTVQGCPCCSFLTLRRIYSTSTIASSYADQHLFHTSLTRILPPID